jgi:hypothetical protein
VSRHNRLRWCRDQDWWPIVSDLLRKGIAVSIHTSVHVPIPEELVSVDLLTGERTLDLRHRETGAYLRVAECDGTYWHIVSAIPMTGIVDEILAANVWQNAAQHGEEH